MPFNPEKKIGAAQQMRIEEREAAMKNTEKKQEARIIDLGAERAKKQESLADKKREKPFDINSASPEELERVEESLGFLGEPKPEGNRILNTVESLKNDFEKTGEGKAVGAGKMEQAGNKMRMALASLVEKMVTENLVCADERGVLKPFEIGNMKIFVMQNTNEDRVLSGKDVYDLGAMAKKIMELLAKNKVTISFEGSKDKEIENLSVDSSSNVEFETVGAKKNSTELLSTLSGDKAAGIFSKLSEQMSAAKGKAQETIDSKKLSQAA